MEYPKISIITPCYNKVEFLAQTIESVIGQGYPNLEFIIIDGGSTDGSVELIGKYADQIAYWESKADRGQSHAMNKGLKRASGEILSIINADDVYCPNIFFEVAKHFKTAQYPTILLGNVAVTDLKLRTKFVRKNISANFLQLAQLRRFQMPNNPVGYFYHRKLHQQIGGFNEKEKYAMDYDFLLKAFQVCKIVKTESTFGKFRFDVNSLTFNHRLKDKYYLHKKALGEIKKYYALLWAAERIAEKINTFDKNQAETYKNKYYRVLSKMMIWIDAELEKIPLKQWNYQK